VPALIADPSAAADHGSELQVLAEGPAASNLVDLDHADLNHAGLNQADLDEADLDEVGLDMVVWGNQAA
jgi:uncharacterized protein YjbI with pentapeptide repeats